MNFPVTRALVPAVAVLVVAGFAVAQSDPRVGTTINDPVGPVPDPTHIPVTLPKDIKCVGKEGAQQSYARATKLDPELPKGGPPPGD